MTARNALRRARRDACFPGVLSLGLGHDVCASLILDGFSVDEITAVGG